jgi:hypothetical protein
MYDVWKNASFFAGEFCDGTLSIYMTFGLLVSVVCVSGSCGCVALQISLAFTRGMPTRIGSGR